jgi:hypothetical protein
MDTAAFVLFTLAVCLGSLYFGFRGISWLFAEFSGWHKLEREFGCDADSRLWTRRRDTVQVNVVRLRCCVDTGVQPDGLYLHVGSIFRWRPLRIPWNRMSAFQPATIYRRSAMRFLVDGVAISVDAPLYAAMYPYLVALR